MRTSAHSLIEAPTWSKWIIVLVSIPISAYILTVYSSFTRPIWIDEFLHYALGSHRSTADAWQSISATLPNLNHGQTGIHMLLDFWLLHYFGASAFVLRLPSLIAAAFLLFSMVQIALRLRFNLGWTLLLLAAIFTQQSLMYFAGEARPYILLAAAVTGTLAFYLTPVEQRARWNRVCGAIAIFIGVLFHPYFPVYWLALAVYTWAIHAQPFTARSILPDFIRHCDAWLSIPAAIVCLVLAKYTWMSGSPDFHMDPFHYLRNDRNNGFLSTFIVLHFEFLRQAYLYIVASVALGLGLLVAVLPTNGRSAVCLRLVPPLALLALALGMSLFFSAISYFREYWILPRQWVASMALCCLGVIWLAREITASLPPKFHLLARPMTGIVGFFVLFLCVIPVHQKKASDVNAVWQTVIHGPPPKASAAPPTTDTVQTSYQAKNNDEWVRLANENIASGGSVWPVFRNYYRPDD